MNMKIRKTELVFIKKLVFLNKINSSIIQEFLKHFEMNRGIDVGRLLLRSIYSLFCILVKLVQFHVERGIDLQMMIH